MVLRTTEDKRVDQTEREKNNPFGYKCFPDCQFFPSAVSSNGMIDYIQLEDYKVRADNNFHFKCNYDGHVIISWTENNCPLGRGGILSENSGGILSENSDSILPENSDSILPSEETS